MSEAWAMLEQEAARLSGSIGAARPDFVGSTFPEAQAFIRDTSPLKYAFCTRRAAKSYSVGLEFVDSAIRLGGKHLILGLTHESVRGAFWDDVLHAIDKRFALGLRFNETRLEVRAPNGGSVRLLGMDANEDEKRKVLGQKYRKVNIDEAQAFKSDLEMLVFKTLGPATIDLSGTISLTGTPGNLTRGLFYEVTSGKRTGWSGHRWDTFKNTCVPEGDTRRMCDQHAAKIAQLKEQNPRVVEVPWFRQEYLGEWVIETDKLVYRYADARNVAADMPAGSPAAGWHFILGCDLGYNDPTAFVVCAYHDHDRTLYILEASSESGLDVTAVARRAQALARRYDFDAMVIDNANKQAVEEMVRRHDLPWLPADKTGKADFIEIMNAEFICGSIKLLPAAAPLAEEYDGLVWDEKKLEAGKREEHPACPNHCTDAALYAWRYAYQYLSEKPADKPPPGQAEWQAEQEREMLEQAQREVAERVSEREERELWG